MSLATKIMERYKQKMSRLVLVPSDGGRFELSVGDTPIYSKLETDEFPDEDAMLAELDKHLLQ